MKKKIFAILFMFFFLYSCWEEEIIVQTEEPPKYVKTEIIEKKQFAELIKLPWKITASQETSISTLSSWIINKINVNIGDSVKAWQILATVDNTSNLTNVSLSNAVVSYNNAVAVYSTTKESLDQTLEAAKLQYENAIISRDNTYSNTEKQLELSQAQLDAVLTQKWNTSESSITGLDVASQNLENAKISLENFLRTSEETLRTLDVKKDSLLDNVKVAIDWAFILYDSSLNEIDKILWVTDSNREYNKNFEIYISAKDNSQKNEARSLFLTNNAEYQTLKNKYNWSMWEEALMSYLNELYTLTNDTTVLFDKMISVLNNSVVSDTLNWTTLDWMKTWITTFQTQLSSLRTNLVNLSNSYKDIINSIESTNTTLATQKSSLEQSIKIAESSYNNTKASINTSLDSVSSSENTTRIQYDSTVESVKSARDTADNSLKIAENQYKAAQANYDAQLASLKSQVDATAWQRNSLSQQMANSSITAPYDWVIISKNIEIWSIVAQWAVAFTIANSNEKIVKLEVNAENAKYLNAWKKVSLKKNSENWDGTISLVWVWSTNSMYPIEITFDNNTNFWKSLMLWDYVDAYIQKEVWENNEIVIPFSALIAWANGIYHVYIVDENNIAKQVNVEIWSSNSNEVVIRSGLKDWDRIIVNWALTVAEWDKVAELENNTKLSLEYEWE